MAQFSSQGMFPEKQLRSKLNFFIAVIATLWTGFSSISLDTALYMDRGDKEHPINHFCISKGKQMVIHAE